MLAFEGMLISAAKEAGMKVPPDDQLDQDTVFDKEQYPHFAVFCALQLRRPMTSPQEHWDNAKVIAEIPEDKLKTMTAGDFLTAGVIGLRA